MTFPALQDLPPDTAFPNGVTEGRDFLELLCSITELLQLYQECFPEAYRQDEEQRVSIFPEDRHDYSPREVNFFKLVDEQYFPLPVAFLPDDLYGERLMAARIPVEGIGFDLYDEERFEDLSFGWQLLLYLLGAVNQEWIMTCSEYAGDFLAGVPVVRAPVNEGLLIDRCEAQGAAPLSYLALAIQVLRNDTDSVWLNVTMDSPCNDAMWTKKDMEELREHYQLARVIIDKVSSFCEWLEEDPRKRFTLVARLWNACARDTTPRETRVKVRQISAADFVEGMRSGEWFGIALPERIADARPA